MSEYKPTYNKGDLVLFSRKYKYKEARITDVTCDAFHANRTHCAMSEFYVYYRIKFSTYGFPRTMWVCGEDVHGRVAESR